MLVVSRRGGPEKVVHALVVHLEEARLGGDNAVSPESCDFLGEVRENARCETFLVVEA